MINPIEWTRSLESEEDKFEKMDILGELKHEFEVPRVVDPISPVDTVTIINLLIDYVLVEKDREIRNAMLEVMMWANYKNFDRNAIHWDLLCNKIGEFEGPELETVVCILGGAHDLKYIPILETFLSHSESGVRESAEEAIEEIKYSSRHVDN